jgi:very-short-patch-repair endonuclease
MGTMSRVPAAVSPRQLTTKPFRGSDAIADGLPTRAQLRGPAWRRLFRDVYVSATTRDDHLLRVTAAALLMPPGAAISGRSAALVWGAPLRDYDGDVEILAPRRFGPVRGLAIRIGPVGAADIADRWGMPVCTALRTCWELARALPDLEAVGWVDALARNRRIRRTQLTAEALRHFGEMGSLRAADILSLCDPRAESPPESTLQVHIHRAGLPTPTPQYRVMIDGEFVARVDLGWPRLKFAVEYDGQWHVDPRQLADDRRSLRALQSVGWTIFHVTRSDMADVDALMGELGAALERRRRELGVR